ncbi:phage tail family protein [Paenibacillus glycanilyticus]|uniref:phage tail domain-containing protein n=1 Tax=Paenibacillus glycanilyticus TaxID=126569 RepID=UPI0020415D34|nr:phage tail domain-containing protein [Paenibacillus glycanilyticus]MCM3628806.1 phage tail family protein [Paenibacillus glycanilyticus]
MAYNNGFTLTPINNPTDIRTARDLGVIMLRQSKRPMLASTVDSTVDIAGMHGAYDFGAKLSPLQFSLECAMITSDYKELQIAIERFAEYMLDETGRPRQFEIIFDAKPTKKYIVRYSGSLDLDRIYGLGKFSLPFVAYDPFSYQTTVSTEEIDWDSNILMDNEKITFDGYTAPIYTISSPQTIEVNNYGAFEVYPVVLAIGSFNSLRISNGGRTLNFNESVSNGTVSLDCQRMQAKLGTTNKNNKVLGQFIKLKPGINNVDIGGTGLNCSVSFVFNAKYT